MIPLHRWSRTAGVIAWVLLSGGAAAQADGPAGPAFARKEVSFRSGGNTLRGVLIAPKARGPHPAVAFVHGSGSLSRNDPTSHPALREHWARHGVASLCWDKPGVGASRGDWTEQSFRDRAREAIDAVRFLQGRPEIDPKRVGLWGISQGGWICPLAASLSRDVAFVILVSAPAGTIEEQDLYRVEQEMRADNRPKGDIDQALAFARLRIAFLRRAPFEQFDAAQREVKGKGWFEGYVHRLAPRDFAFARKNLSYDGRPVLRGVRCPVLILVGGRDTIVPARKSAALIERALKKAGNKDVTVKTFADADHFMHAAKTGGPRERFAKGRKQEFVPDYFPTVTGWLAPRVRPAS
jgi:pimeloyl-ACP methyl ester carboxylesterase